MEDWHGSQNFLVDNERAWTTDRCMSLLRPLINDLAALRNYVKARGDDPSHAAGPTAKPKRRENAEDEPHESLRDQSSDCAAQTSPSLWKSDSKFSKRVKTTYSNRNRQAKWTHEGSQQSISTQKLWQRKSLHRDPPKSKEDERCSVTAHRSRVKSIDASRDAIVRHLKYGARGQWALIDAIYTSFLGFLQTSDTRDQLEHEGARPLFEICLKEIPLYIAEEERWCKAHHPASAQDVLSTVYNNLEDFNSCNYGTRHPLKKVVRFHAVHLIANAITEGIIEPLIAKEFVLCCIREDALDEANVLLECLLSTEELCIEVASSLDLNVHVSGEPQGGQRRGVVGDTLQQVLKDTKQSRYLFSWLMWSIEVDAKTSEWMNYLPMAQRLGYMANPIEERDEHSSHCILLVCAAITRFFVIGRRCVGGELHDLRRKSHVTMPYQPNSHANTSKASDFVRRSKTPRRCESMSALTGSDAPALRLVLVSLTTLTVSHLVQNMRLQLFDDNQEMLNSPLLGIVIELHQILELDSVFERQYGSSDFLGSVAILPLVAGLIVETCSDTRNTRALNLQHRSLQALGQFHVTETTFRAAVDLICDTATQSARILGRREEFCFLRDLIDGFIDIWLSSAASYNGLKICFKILSAAAFAFCSKGSNKGHLQWAFEIERKTCMLSKRAAIGEGDESPGQKVLQSSNQYQWDDGLSEWIAKTPNACFQSPTRKQAMQRELDNAGGTSTENSLTPTMHFLSDTPWTGAKAEVQGTMQSIYQTPSTKRDSPVVQKQISHARVRDSAPNFRDLAADCELPAEAWTREFSDEDELALPQVPLRPLYVSRPLSRIQGRDASQAIVKIRRRPEDEKSTRQKSSKRSKSQPGTGPPAVASAARPILGLGGQALDLEDELSLAQ